MKKMIGILKPKYLLICPFAYLLWDFLLDGPLRKLGFFSFIYLYFGRFALMVCTLFILGIFINVFKNSHEKLFPFNIEMIILGIVCCSYLYIMLHLRIPISAAKADRDVIMRSMDLAVFKYKFGLLPSYVFYLMLMGMNYIAMYGVIGSLFVLSVFVVVIYPTAIMMRDLHRSHKEKVQLKEEEKRINMIIAMKEKMIQKEAEQMRKPREGFEESIKEQIKRKDLKAKLAAAIDTTGHILPIDLNKKQKVTASLNNAKKHLNDVFAFSNDIIDGTDFFLGTEPKKETRDQSAHNNIKDKRDNEIDIDILGVVQDVGKHDEDDDYNDFSVLTSAEHEHHPKKKNSKNFEFIIGDDLGATKKHSGNNKKVKKEGPMVDLSMNYKKKNDTVAFDPLVFDDKGNIFKKKDRALEADNSFDFVIPTKNTLSSFKNAKIISVAEYLKSSGPSKNEKTKKTLMTRKILKG